MLCIKIFLSFLLIASVVCEDSEYVLNIIHFNDFHARFQEITTADEACTDTSENCIGGIARLATLINSRLAEEPDSLVLNAGDTFQGTIWYNLLKWNVTQEFINLLPIDVQTLGNHEFDDGIEGLVPYVQHLIAPVVLANMDDSEEPSLQDLYQPSVVVTKNGRKIGIIGVVLSRTSSIAPTGNLKFRDEVEAVREESEKLHKQGIDIIVVLSHSGYDVDMRIAAEAGPYVDVIVGGHSHTLLYDGIPPVNDTFVPEGSYPTVVKQDTGKEVPIVQAAAFSHYLGEIKLYFNETGDFLRWAGNPHYVGNEIVPDPAFLRRINDYLPIIEELRNIVVGETLVDLDRDCWCDECTVGNLICDAFLEAAKERSSAHFCVQNRGTIRSGISAGVITYEDLLVSTPYANNIEVFELRGDYIKEMLEFSVINDPYGGANMLQVSGIRVAYDGTRPAYDRLISAEVLCNDCDVPVYEPLEMDKYYRIVTNNFLGEGGDGYTMISDNRRDVEVIGVDIDILTDYVKENSPLNIERDGRIIINEPCIH